eukprot:SAG11_NODE_26748_length_341_cov_0.855372_1_plen_106_part_01
MELWAGQGVKSDAGVVAELSVEAFPHSEEVCAVLWNAESEFNTFCKASTWGLDRALQHTRWVSKFSVMWMLGISLLSSSISTTVLVWCGWPIGMYSSMPGRRIYVN